MSCSEINFIKSLQRSFKIADTFRVTAELDRLQKEGHIKKVSSCSDEHLISLIVITVKKDQSIKLALDSKV